MIFHFLNSSIRDRKSEFLLGNGEVEPETPPSMESHLYSRSVHYFCLERLIDEQRAKRDEPSPYWHIDCNASHHQSSVDIIIIHLTSQDYFYKYHCLWILQIRREVEDLPFFKNLVGV